MKTVVLDHKKNGHISHIEGLNNEYTLCGLAIADSSINIEGFEWLQYAKEENPNCKECIKIVNFCKQIPSSILKRKQLNPFQ